MIVYGVYRNQDMTEGRGPMVLDRLYTTREAAETYANLRRGVMGRQPFRDHASVRASIAPQYQARWDDPVCLGWFCKVCYPYGGDWRVQEHTVIEGEDR